MIVHLSQLDGKANNWLHLIAIMAPLTITCARMQPSVMAITILVMPLLAHDFAHTSGSEISYRATSERHWQLVSEPISEASCAVTESLNPNANSQPYL